MVAIHASTVIQPKCQPTTDSALQRTCYVAHEITNRLGREHRYPVVLPTRRWCPDIIVSERAHVELYKYMEASSPIETNVLIVPPQTRRN